MRLVRLAIEFVHVVKQRQIAFCHDAHRAKAR